MCWDWSIFREKFRTFRVLVYRLWILIQISRRYLTNLWKLLVKMEQTFKLKESQVLSDKLDDIAAFTVEKNQFLENDSLSPEQQKEAEQFILEALQKVVAEYDLVISEIREKCVVAARQILKDMIVK